MKLNKTHPSWDSAPWHVKVSCWGSGTYAEVKRYLYLSLTFGVGALIWGLVAYFFGDGDFMGKVYVFAAACFAAAMYAIAVRWLDQHPAVLTEA